MNKTLNNLLLAILFTMVSTTQVFAKEKSLSFAFFPYVNPSKILQHNKGLKHFLTKELKHPVSLITAKNSLDYFKKVKKSSYDIIFSAPHIGRYAELYAGYKRVAVTTNRIQGLYIVRESSKISQLSDLKNKTIAMASSVTILHQIALDDLKHQNLTPGKDITVKETKNHLNAIFALIKGKADVALTGVLLWKKLPKKYKSQLRLLDNSTKICGFTVMAHKNLKPELLEKAKKSLLHFHESKEGTKYLFKGFRTLSDKDMKQLDPYIDIFK